MKRKLNPLERHVCKSLDDTARLDWLEKNWLKVMVRQKGNLRQAIDEAMKGSE